MSTTRTLTTGMATGAVLIAALFYVQNGTGNISNMDLVSGASRLRSSLDTGGGEVGLAGFDHIPCEDIQYGFGQRRVPITLLSRSRTQWRGAGRLSDVVAATGAFRVLRGIGIRTLGLDIRL